MNNALNYGLTALQVDVPPSKWYRAASGSNHLLPITNIEEPVYAYGSHIRQLVCIASSRPVICTF